MSSISILDIIKANPIGKALDAFRSSLESFDGGNARSPFVSPILTSAELKNLGFDLVSALQSLPVCRLLPSRIRLGAGINSSDFDVDRVLPLQRAIFNKEPDEDVLNKATDAVAESTPPRPLPYVNQTPLTRNTSSFVNSSEHRKYMDGALKEELASVYIGVPRFYEIFFREVDGLTSAAEAVFKKCKEGDDPLGLEGSTADRKLDFGFVDDPKASETSKCHWSQVLVPEELKSNHTLDTVSQTLLDLGRCAREVLAAQDSRRFVLGFTLCGPVMRLWSFDRAGAIASPSFGINMEGQQFVIRRAACVVGRATTCWKAYREGDESREPLVIKDSWQYLEREEEGLLLQEATEKNVTNVARYYHHETVCVGSEVDDVYGGVRKGLDTSKATNYKPKSSIMLPPLTKERGRSAGSVRKRSRSAALTQSCRPASELPNRVHRCVIVRDYGKPIYRASSRGALLGALMGCIEGKDMIGVSCVLHADQKGYKNLHETGNIWHCDISQGNLMINENEENPSRSAFLIDLDLAVRVQREEPSGARGKTGTRAFMAIGALLNDEKRTFMHDIESFFWVLFWTCIHYRRLDERGRVVPKFDKWNFMGTELLANLKKGIVVEEMDFLKTVGQFFTPYYQPLIPCVNRVRRVVFPGGRRRRKPDPTLYSDMKKTLQEAQKDLRDHCSEFSAFVQRPSVT
ncbi:hypothetical protein P152DRAFT_467085 [Eremomyces bilateralis CBS 781.70]|uniref:Fungal-type protein kinase domain-containing protein n=1 Tax=Eremomyces bilateralis CBS 781.70 TaxID=1392243 RepID=A0A6G1G057_9PEZI|nr:uncharacterized protein P152DRAFT_467085 [Eremomyces bilateralis CBS 781.70]KAF1811423.1 hypothetical protein P152DRAFT_467085 [Eremomyces bilateralis CBS 781.70]